jgi:hypothetical protein
MVCPPALHFCTGEHLLQTGVQKRMFHMCGAGLSAPGGDGGLTHAGKALKHTHTQPHADKHILHCKASRRTRPAADCTKHAIQCITLPAYDAKYTEYPSKISTTTA